MARRRPDLSAINDHLHSEQRYAPSFPLDLLASLIPVAPDILHHYTSAEGLKGILESNSFRATHVGHMNDFDEVQRGIQLVQAEYDEFRRKNRGRVKGLLPRAKLADLCASLDVFAFCLSTRRDLLSQWRAYADHGRGYSVGVWRADLAQMIHSPTQSAVIPVRIDYGENAAASMAYVEGYVRAAEQQPELSVPLLRNHIADMLVAEALKFKNPAFAEEGEWRYAIVLPQNAEGVEVATKNGRLVPYVNLTHASGQLPVFEICAGPASGSTQGAKSLLRKCGYSAIVDRSEAPFRA